jgi:large exoprotein involved in heme utilization and adhesion
VIRSDSWGTGKAGVVSVEADHLVISGYGNTGITSDTRALRKDGTNRGATSPAGNVTVKANTLELRDFGKIHSNTETVGKAGSVTIQADRLLIVGTGGEKAEEGEYTGISTDARTGSAGAAGNVTVIVEGALELRDGGVISSNTQAIGNAGAVHVEANRLFASGDGSQTFTGISSATSNRSTGAGGAVNIHAQSILLQDQGAVSTQSDGTGPGGSLSITARDTLQLDHAAIQAKTETADGGNITLDVGRLFDLHNSTVSTSVAGGTGRGGNIFVVRAPFLVLDSSNIIANAQRGAGGRIGILADHVVQSSDSVIRASSAQSISGIITISAPNTDISSSLVVLPETFLDASSQWPTACASRPTSSFKASGRGGLPPDPGAPLAASPFEQPPGQQTATGSPTAPTPRSPQAARTILVAGIPHPILGAPHPTCRG